MNLKTEHLIKLLESWEKAYLAPSATMVIKEAKEAVLSLSQEVDMLTALVKEQKKKIEELSKPVEPRFPVQSKKVKKPETSK